MKVVIVADQQDERSVLRGILEGLNCEVLDAANGAEGFEVALLEHPDVIVSDSSMPGVDGITLLRNIRHSRSLPLTPFVFCSPPLSAEEHELATELGVEAWVDNATPPEELAVLLRKILRQGGHRTGIPVCERSRGADHLNAGGRSCHDIIRALRDVYFRTDTDGRLQFVSPSIINLLGYSPEDLCGAPADVLFREGSEAVRLFEKTCSDGFVNDWETQLFGPQGSSSNVSISAHLINDMDGTVMGIEGIMRDITERKSAEAQIRQSQKMEALGTLCGGIAHDFNNILTAIIGFANVLLLRLQNEGLHYLVENIISSAERAATLTTSLLAFSRKQRFELRSANLNVIVKEMEPLLARLLPENVRLELSPCDAPLPIMADPGQMGHVLMNLTTNARDAMPSGGRITVSTSRTEIDQHFTRANGFGSPGSYALLTFSDTGFGITETAMQRIFEPFFTTKERGKGTGLGLSIVYGVVKQHDGFIACSSIPGEGTTFRFYFPLRRTEEPPRKEVALARGQERLLLVESDGTMREMICDILRTSGYEVVEAADGGQALDVVRTATAPVDLVVLNLLLPDGSSRQIAEVARGRNPSLPILYTATVPAATIPRGAIIAPDDGILHLPVEPEVLLADVRRKLQASLVDVSPAGSSQ